LKPILRKKQLMSTSWLNTLIKPKQIMKKF